MCLDNPWQFMKTFGIPHFVEVLPLQNHYMVTIYKSHSSSNFLRTVISIPIIFIVLFRK